MLFALLCLTTLNAQVTKTNSTPGTADGSQFTRTVNFTPAELGGCTSLTDVNLALDWEGPANHTVEQIAVRIQSPAGTIVDVVYDTQGTLTGDLAQQPTYGAPAFASWSQVVTVFDDEGTAIPPTSVPQAGAWIPAEALSLFDGENAAGTWTITVSDHTDNVGFDDYTQVNSIAVTIECAAACSNPDVPTVTFTPATICNGNNATLNIAGSLNDATAWHVYTSSCGGTSVGSTASSSISVTPSTPSTTYFIRGEGGCVTPGSCGQVVVSVNALPSVTFTAPADLCVDAGVQAGLGSGSPTGGVYSGAGVTDDGNGSTYSFDPAAAGAGTHTITYTYTDGNGCANSANDAIEVFALPALTFTASADLCIDAGVQAGLGSGSPTGGTYSGTGVTDDGNGTTYSFDPAAAGVGTHTITYSYTDGNGCANSTSDAVEVFALPTVTYTALADLCENAGVQAGLGSGSPTGGAYSGAGVTDDGNGTTYSFDPAAAGVGTHTITYSYTDGNGCTSSANDDVEVTTADDASFSYSAAAYCVTDTDPSPTVTGLTGGAFSSTSGLDIDGTSGAIDLDNSTAGTYTVTYTTTGPCPNSETFDVTINVTDDASFSYAAANYCPNDADPTPTVTGLTGGDFSSTSGLDIDGTSGAIDLDNSTQGTYTVTYTTAGSCPNSATFDVTIEDNTDPVDPGALPDLTDVCSVTPIAPTTTDACAGTITGTTTTSFPITDGGTTVVTWTFDDGNGNSITVDQNVIITDSEAPADPGALADLTDECSVTPTPPTTTDNCAGTITGTTTTSFPITTQGTTVVTWTFDDGRGNVITADQNVIIDDVTDPDPVGPLADLTDECSVTPVAPTTTDNCAGTITGTTTETFPITTQGTTVVTWTFDDGNGNVITADQNVIIDDVTDPVIPILADVNLECGTDPTAPTTTDNCAGTVTGTHSETLPLPLGLTVVTWTFDDGNGNVVTADQNITVGDGSAPIPVGVPLAPITAECELTTLPAAPTAIDACAGTITGTTTATGPWDTQGTFTITWTFEDGNGNSSSTTQNIIIDDVTAPVADAASLADVTGLCSVDMPTAPTATDNCAGSITGTTTTMFPITTKGTTVITWTFDDGNGNTSTQTQNIVITGVDASVTVDADSITANNANGTYQWIDCVINNDLAGATNQSYTPTVNGSYAVIVTEAGCSDTSECVVINNVSIQDITYTTFTMSPNPTVDGRFSIDHEGAIAKVEVVDMIGRTMTVHTDLEKGIVDASSLAAGKYVVRVLTQAGEQLAGQIVIAK